MFPACTNRCNNLTACRLCKRRLPRHCFDFADSTICQMKKPTVIPSARQIVTEVEIPTDESDISLESFSSRNSGHINEVIREYQQRMK